MASQEPHILGDKYRLVRQLDEGGMGSVWLAEHLSLHSPVAVKLLTQDIADSDEGVQRFLREARAAASLRSPHVVQILDYGVDSQSSEEVRPYIVMELLEGESLAQRLARVQRLNPQQTALVFRHVGRAVARAHDAGIVHRDLKPSNIFITSNEDEELIKLLDFGIAKAALDVLGVSIASNTRTGAFLGTPYYVSPEQAEGSKNLDHRTDIWALGVIAYECLLGRLPFFGETFGSLVLSICSRPMPVPSQNGQVPAGFDEWFARACARDVQQRFQSVRDATSSLRQLLEPGTAEAVTLGQHSQAVRAGIPPAPLGNLQTEALPSLPAPELGLTTAAASSSNTTRRRSVPGRSRVVAWSGLGALALTGLVVAISLSGSRGQQPLAAPLTARESAPLAPVPGAMPEARAASTAQLSPAQASRSPAEAPAAASGIAGGPNVAPVREPPLLSGAPERPKSSAPRARSAAPQVAKGEASPTPPAVEVPASTPATPRATQEKAGQGTAESPKAQPPPASRAKQPGRHGVNLGI